MKSARNKYHAQSIKPPRSPRYRPPALSSPSGPACRWGSGASRLHCWGLGAGLPSPHGEKRLPDPSRLRRGGQHLRYAVTRGTMRLRGGTRELSHPCPERALLLEGHVHGATRSWSGENSGQTKIPGLGALVPGQFAGPQQPRCCGGRAHPARGRALERKAGGPKGVTFSAGPWGPGVGSPLVPVHVCLAS